MNKFKASFVFATLISSSAFAANFDISPLGELPVNVSKGKSVVANYKITNLTQSARTNYMIQGLPATVWQNPASPYCGNPITLAAQTSCQLQLVITGAVHSSFALCKGESCTTTSAPLNVNVD